MPVLAQTTAWCNNKCLREVRMKGHHMDTAGLAREVRLGSLNSVTLSKLIPTH